MDLNAFKEECINSFKNLSNTIANSPAAYLIKEKYDHLSSLHRKIIYSVCMLILACLLLYYPASRLILAGSNMRDFRIKKTLIKELVDLSSAKQLSSSQSYAPNQDPVLFIKNRIVSLQIPENQVKNIKKSKNFQKTKNLPLPSKVESVEIEMTNLNLKEIAQYGHQLEQLSDNIKLTNIRIIENKEKDNYFNVSYILSFFNLTKYILSSEDRKQENPELPKQENNKIFDKLTPKNPPKPPPPSLNDTSKIKKEDTGIPLMDTPKGNIINDSTHFENRPDRVKKRDLLPPLPTPKKKKGPSPLFNSPDTLPPPPSTNKPLQPDVQNTQENKE